MKKLRRPDYFFPYTVYDLGFIDRTGGLYGGHDYENDVIFVEDEDLLVRPSSRDIADAVAAKESVLWVGNPHAPTRIMDAAPFVLEDIRREHHLNFQPPDKSGVQSGISYVQGANNYVNLLINGAQLRVHKRCVNLLRQMRNAMWNKQRNDFERDKREGIESMGHYDLAAALVYFCRAIDRKRNPFPPGYRTKAVTSGENVWREHARKKVEPQIKQWSGKSDETELARCPTCGHTTVDPKCIVCGTTLTAPAPDVLAEIAEILTSPAFEPAPEPAPPKKPRGRKS